MAARHPLVKRFRRFLDTRWFDIRYGVETAGVLEVADFSTGADSRRHAKRYDPCHTSNLDAALRWVLDHDPTAVDGVLVDYGCGKGKACIRAAQFGFRRLVGIEFNQDLCAVAVANLTRLGFADRVSVVHGDALEVEPPADLSVAFIYNPFGPEVLRPVAARLARAVTRRPAHAIYVNARHPECFDGWRVAAALPRHRTVIYTLESAPLPPR